jgi:hypothetical protein
MQKKVIKSRLQLQMHAQRRQIERNKENTKDELFIFVHALTGYPNKSERV